MSGLLSLIKQVPEYQQLRMELLGLHYSMCKLVVTDAAKSYVIAALFQELGLPVLLITSQPENARRLYDQLRVWCSDPASVLFFPEIDFLAGKYSVTDPITVTERLQTLSALTLTGDSLPGRRDCFLVVSSALAVASKTLPRVAFTEACHTLDVGMDVDPLQLLRRWQDIGYELENTVEVPGTISRRGGIVDIFPQNSDLPVRIDFFGNQIDSIRLFDPRSQRSSEVVTSVLIAPAREHWGHSNTGTILDYLDDEALLIIDNPDEIETVIDQIDSQTKEFRESKIEHGELTQDSLASYLTWVNFEAKIKEIKRCLALYSWSVDNTDGDCLYSLPLGSVPSYGGSLDVFSKGLKEMLGKNRRIVIVSQQTKRLDELLQEQDILPLLIPQVEQLPSLKTVTLVQGTMDEGWVMKDMLTLLTDLEIFGLVKERRISKKRPICHHLLVSELRQGDYVVHIEHGIAKFVGLTTMIDEDNEREYLVLEYAAGDRLYVPTDQVDRVSRYIGAGNQILSLSRLGTQEWERTKQRIKKNVVEVAQALLNLHAARETMSGFGFSPDSPWQQELESSFPYIETPDQLEVVQAVKNDMEKSKPMDRLVCGDVGYGKTEVALRAAFKAVMDNKQVALLVPTTVLAQQHYATFSERLQAFPVKMGMLSRFCTEKEQARVIEDLAAGIVDICIGTHRLIQKDVLFNDLGLVIIDEEQRFGVTHKEHFKKLRHEVDVLTLSATPIPRTLHMSLAGIRDINTMETPPEERLPVKTYVGIYSDNIVREAVLREIERNGQVFFVHNRVRSIASVANRLSSLIPEARISIAHGQMSEEELGKVMTEFSRRRSDVLVTTTIIESGLDMPNVNTLIIDQADKLGLTQLYQLRGRVGRGSNHAYAYFLFDKGKQLTLEARRRLRTMSEATELGAGFAIAMKDLEIRGAGNLLGVEQSGYIAAVGFSLYSRLLAEAVDELKQRQDGERERKVLQSPVPIISIPITAYIPEEYISVLSIRLNFYRRLADIRRIKDIDDVDQELSDRFGPLPQPVRALLYIMSIRQLAMKANVESISTKDGHIILQFGSARGINRLFRDYGDGVRFGTRQIKLDVKHLGNSWQQELERILKEESMDV